MGGGGGERERERKRRRRMAEKVRRVERGEGIIGTRSRGSLIEITVNHGSTRVQKRKSREQAVPSTPSDI